MALRSGQDTTKLGRISGLEVRDWGKDGEEFLLMTT